MICDLILWALGQGWKVVLYTNRQLLILQLAAVLREAGIEFGVRAAGHPLDRDCPVQVSSLPTENSRVLRTKRWVVHGHGEPTLAIIDEAHINASRTAQQILAMHLDHGGAYVGVTATPIGIGHLYDRLVVAGTPSELRDCRALVPAYHYGPDEPDMSRFKQSVKTGEYLEGDVRKAIMTKCVFARVLDHYHAINRDRRPTILIAPGVPESIWFAEQLCKAGLKAAHLDGEGVWAAGEYQRGGDREWLLKAVKNGDIHVLCNRFVLREGLNIPEVSHIILATVMGSLRSYLQAAGRGLRACAGKDRLTLQDHGGHHHRHGSVNADRTWNLAYTESMIAGLRADAFRERKQAEPILCPVCGLVRSKGPKCPKCGHESSRRMRRVIQMDGTLCEVEGDVYKPRRVQMRRNTEQIWERIYYLARQSRNRMTFRQAMGLFVKKNHYWPPHELPLMPVNQMDWFLPVADVPPDRLVPKPVPAG
jgi:superfamily II DNA or RNA helicase